MQEFPAKSYLQPLLFPPILRGSFSVTAGNRKTVKALLLTTRNRSGGAARVTLPPPVKNLRHRYTTIPPPIVAILPTARTRVIMDFKFLFT